jgi:anti-sigma B factor antagonist
MDETHASVRRVGDVAIMDIVGDLTPDAREAVDTAHREVTAAGVVKLVVSFQSDAYINSGGIAVIINLAIAGTESGQKIRLVQPSPHFRKIFTMVGLRQYVEIFSDEAGALGEF